MRKGGQVTTPTPPPPPNRTDRDSGVAVSGVGGQTDRLTGASQDAVSEEAVTLVGNNRTGKRVEAEMCEGVVVTTPTTPHQDGHRM